MRINKEVLSLGAIFKSDRRGQAAMEFLMTYGWAILAAVIVVGVLWYLIGSPSNLAGTNFQISAPLVAKGVTVSAAQGVNLNIMNGAGSTVTITNVTITGCGSLVPVANTTIAVGVESNYVVSCSPALVVGDRLNADIIVRYREGASTFDRQATGTVSGKVA